MSRFKLGLTLEPLDAPIRAAIALAGKFGVAGVEANAVGDLAPERLGETGRRELRNLLRSHNLELAALGCPLRRGLDAREYQSERVEYVRQIMQLAFDLGPRRVVVPLPQVPTEPENPRAVTLREVLRDLAGFGDRIGTQLVLEVGLDTGEAVREYLSRFDCGSLAVTYDPANFLLNGHDPLTNLGALAGRIGHVHARDGRIATVSGGAREVAVGAGDVEWMVLFATLESIDYRGYIVVDRKTGEDRAADVRKGIAFLRRFVAGV
ncbi:MAG: sugar phosphate isomerase/epimerase [Bacteroidales bacterium]|nr:sugar phosphate isomerase/epimerase [Bacteroidales bacterium]